VCGRYNLITDAEALVDFFDIDQVLFEASGLVPHWSREPKTKYSTINARAETVAEKPGYRGAFKRKRCLIPANPAGDN